MMIKKIGCLYCLRREIYGSTDCGFNIDNNGNVYWYYDAPFVNGENVGHEQFRYCPNCGRNLSDD